MKVICKFALALLLLCAGSATAATYYVSPTGSDSNTGTASDNAHAWLTIQHAATNVPDASNAVSVLAGTYKPADGASSEVVLSRAMTTTTTVTCATNQACFTKGWKVSGNNWIIDGFDISTQDMTNGADSDGSFGIYIRSTVTNLTVRNNLIHDLCSPGIEFDSNDTTSSGVVIRNNTVKRGAMAAVEMAGTGNVLGPGNDLSDTIEFPSRLGGVTANCLAISGFDADYIRVWGVNPTIVGNTMHDLQFNGRSISSLAGGGGAGGIACANETGASQRSGRGDGTCGCNPTIGSNDGTNTACFNPDPHIDFVQTFTNGITGTLTVDSNKVSFPLRTNGQLTGTDSTGTFYGAPIGDISELENCTATLLFKNNIFHNMFRGSQVETTCTGAKKYINNTFDNIWDAALYINASNVAGDDFEDNSFIDVGHGSVCAMRAPFNPFLANGKYNHAYMRNPVIDFGGGTSLGTTGGTGPCPTWVAKDGVTSMANVNPLIVNFGAAANGPTNSEGQTPAWSSPNLAITGADYDPFVYSPLIGAAAAVGAGTNIGASQLAMGGRGAGPF